MDTRKWSEWSDTGTSNGFEYRIRAEFPYAIPDLPKEDRQPVRKPLTAKAKQARNKKNKIAKQSRKQNRK